MRLLRRLAESSDLAWAASAAAIVYVALLLFGDLLLSDPDTFWHLAAGQWILAHDSVPRVDVFSLTAGGAPWISHEWLAELAFAGAFRAAGWAGVVVLTAGAAALAFGLLVRALLRFLEPSWAVILGATSFMLAAPHLTARPHVLAMPCFVAWTVGLVRARAAERPPSLRLLPLMTLWANFHGGFVIGIGVAGALAIEAIVSHRAWRSVAARWGVFLLAAAGASLLTPHGLRGWWLSLHLAQSPFALEFVQEWHRPDFSRLQPVELWIAGAVAILVVNRVRVGFVRAALLAGIVLMALRHVRHAELLAVIGPLLLAEPLSRRLRRSNAAVTLAPGAILPTALGVCLAATVLVPKDFTRGHAAIAPSEALQAARNAHVAGAVFNDYNFGGFLIFEGIPVFVDGRVDLYGDAFMRDYADALNGDRTTLLGLLDRYGVTWTILEPSSPAVSVLDGLPGWRRVHADEFAVVHAMAP